MDPLPPEQDPPFSIVPDYEYRENPKRAIYVDDVIDHPLLLRITKDYHRLKAESNDPITVYISSPGGDVRVFEWIKDVFWTPDQDGDRPTIITVAKGLAASAAARLLVFGDYSISYPSALIHCHGTRLQKVDEVTREVADAISRSMEDSNKATADEYNGKIIANLAFLIDSNRSAIEEISNINGMALVPAFASFINSRLGLDGAGIMAEVFEDLHETDSLHLFLTKIENVQALATAQAQGNIEYETTLLKLIVDFLLEHKWSNASRLSDAFSHDLRRLFNTKRNFQKAITEAHKYSDILPYLLSATDLDEATAADQRGESDQFLKTRVIPLLYPLLQLASSISHRLMKGENPLTALDAYWLGLVQEVLGSGLPCARHLAEMRFPDIDDTEDAPSLSPAQA